MSKSRSPLAHLGPTSRRSTLRLAAGGIAAVLLPRNVPVAAQDPEHLQLASIPLPAMPGETSWALYAITISPDQETNWTATLGACCPGPRIEHVLSGTYRVRAEGPTQVLRAGRLDDPEDVAAGVEVLLEAGDTRITRSEDAFVATNSGSDPVELLLGAIGPGEPVPVDWSFGAQDWELSLTLPAGETVLRLLEVTLAADETYPLPAGAIDQLAIALEDTGTLGLLGGGKLRNLGSTPLAVYVLSLEPAALENGASAATPTA